MTTPASCVDDATLVAAALGGEQAAFAALFEEHRAAIFRLIRAQVGDEDEALDLTQESFASAFAALASFDRSLRFRPWISRIALNKCRDRARRRFVRRLFSFARPIEEAADVADPMAGPETIARDRAALDRAIRAIAALPASLREPLTLCTLDELSQRDAARVLGISEKAIELRIRRARAQLAAMLPEDGEAE